MRGGRGCKPPAQQRHRWRGLRPQKARRARSRPLLSQRWRRLRQQRTGRRGRWWARERGGDCCLPQDGRAYERLPNLALPLQLLKQPHNGRHDRVRGPPNSAALPPSARRNGLGESRDADRRGEAGRRPRARGVLDDDSQMHVPPGEAGENVRHPPRGSHGNLRPRHPAFQLLVKELVPEGGAGGEPSQSADCDAREKLGGHAAAAAGYLHLHRAPPWGVLDLYHNRRAPSLASGTGYVATKPVR
mmetsp:Transcript_36910/g.116072  ORF Transcript_36910/g.116072 Transcript_36910/m.116072 type:complete len:245 (+) Transcript_36910:305-1039(+)